MFQKAFISALFGFVDRETGLRQYREAMFYVARKNGKSTMLAGIALYMMIADREAGAEIYCVATKRDQARLIFEEAYNMIKQSPQLRELVRKRKGDLYFANTFSKMEALSKDSGSMDGLNSHCVVIDELHGIKDRNLYEVMKQSQSARRQPLLIKKIRIIAFTSTTNEHGFNTEEWRPIHSGRLWAYYRQLSGSEFYASAMVNAAEEVVFTVNHRTDVTTEMLVEYGGKFYDIKRIDKYEGYTDDISLYCKLSNDQNIEVTEPDAASV